MLLESGCYEIYLGSDPGRKDGNCIEETTMYIAGRHEDVATVVPFLVDREKHGGHRQKDGDVKYGRMVKTAKNGNVREIMKHRIWESVTVEE